jgi:hypothetical protein
MAVVKQMTQKFKTSLYLIDFVNSVVMLATVTTAKEKGFHQTTSLTSLFKLTVFLQE